tara:strand:- start:165 stop:290 length:126 start_codon:yes stop_codon:yes gene_type:complete
LGNIAILDLIFDLLFRQIREIILRDFVQKSFLALFFKVLRN